MGYRRISYKEKIKAVEAVNNGMRLSEVARILGIPKTTISNWLANDEFNPDKEYVRIRAERKGSKKHAQKNPFPEGVEMARNKDPQELERENRDLRKKTAYLEDKVAYLEALYEIIKEIPDTISKKRCRAISKVLGEGHTNVRRLCAIADVSPKWIYSPFTNKNIIHACIKKGINK